MSCNDCYRDLPINFGSASKYFSDDLMKELTLIYYRYPQRHDAEKACLDKARTFALGDQKRIIWEACAENFRQGRVFVRIGQRGEKTGFEPSLGNHEIY